MVAFRSEPRPPGEEARYDNKKPKKLKSKTRIFKGRKIIKNVGVGQNLDRDLKNFKKEFYEKDKPKTPEERKMTPGTPGKSGKPDLPREAVKIKEPMSPTERMNEKKAEAREQRITLKEIGMAKGGRIGYKAGSKGCKLAMKGKGRAYGKNS